MIQLNSNDNLLKFIGLLIVFILMTGCDKHTPKPIGYNRIDSTETKYVDYNFSNFSFKYPDQVRIDTLRSKAKNEVWFNMVYPKYGAMIYCTYLPVSKSSLPKALEDSYRLAYSHSVKADRIGQMTYSNAESKVSGTIYSIEGSVATPIQFFLTDSTSHFFRGSFYYIDKVNADSVAPITGFVLKDIQQMMATFRWKN